MTNISNSLNPSGIKTESYGTNGKVPKNKLWVWRVIFFVLPVLILIAAVVGFMAMGALKPKPEKKEDVVKAIPVLTAKATQEDVTLSVEVQGEVHPRTKISLVPQVGGLITYMSPNFIEGGQFKKGDLLVRIEPEEFELRVTQAKAEVAQAETLLSRETSESLVARQDWNDLGRSGDPTPLTLREPQMAEAKAKLASAKAALAEAQLHLARTALYAPFTGRVTVRNVDQGEFVSMGTKLGEIYSTEIMDVRLPMTNDDLRRAGLKLGFAVTKDTPALPVTLTANVAGINAQWTGRIVRTDSHFDTTSRVLYAYAEVDDPFGKGADKGIPLAPGIFVNAAVAGQKLQRAILIPRSALRGEDKVYVANSDETLSIKTVSVMSSNRERAVLGSGLAIGDNVITSPIRGVADKMKIEVVKPTKTAALEASLVGDK
jgi:RND family efflux transporter MFP subunit